MSIKLKKYKNTTELASLNGIPLYMNDFVDASLRARLNLFLQGDTGSGKTQILRDVTNYFGDKYLFILGRNDMDTRELFQQVNPEFLKVLKEGSGTATKFKDLSDKINYNFIGVDEISNCIPVVRTQLFNLFDGFIEIDGKAYPLGSGYCVGMATGNIGQQFTESSNELGRALKDRMHLTIDTDYFRPRPINTQDMLVEDKNPRVNFCYECNDNSSPIIKAHQDLLAKKVPFEKYIIANYLIHGLDYLEGGKSKIKMKSGWPNKLESHESGSDASLILPVSPRAAKSILSLSQALDQITEEKGADNIDFFNSMMVAFKFVGAYSGILNEAKVREIYDESRYDAIDAVIATTKSQFDANRSNIAAGIHMASLGKKEKKLLDRFSGRWLFMKSTLEDLAGRVKNDEVS